MRVVAEGLDPGTTRAGDVVTYDPVLALESETIETVAARMREHGIRRLPIVDDRGLIVGMVTSDDLAVMLGRELANVTEAIDDAADSTDSR
jgi:CBS domain-containing protein